MSRWGRVLCLLVLAGCGSDAHSAATNPAAQGQKEPEELAADAAREVCEAFASSLDLPTDEQLCTSEALWQASTPGECEAYRDKCILETRAAPVYEPLDVAECTVELTQQLMGCEASADEVKDCVRAELARSAAAYQELACSDAGVYLDPVDEEEDALLPECERLYSRCPQLVDDAVVQDGGYVCDDGYDIPDEYVCDGFSDCEHSEDEAGCESSDEDPIEEGDGGFICNDDVDIYDAWVCDGEADCMGGEDELDCTPDYGNGDGGFICEDGFDIADTALCDNFRDCSTGEDEMDCDEADAGTLPPDAGDEGTGDADAGA